MSAKKHIFIYTDGACQGNPGPGGWAALLKWGVHQKEIYGGEKETTNNRMELKAAIEALRILKESCSVELYTDSQYVKKGITEWILGWKERGWKNAAKKSVKNQDLWEELNLLTERHQIHWHWVKGHAGHSENEYVDMLARKGITKIETNT